MILATIDLNTIQGTSALIGIIVGIATLVALLVSYYYKAKIENIERKHATGIFTDDRGAKHSVESSTLVNIAYGMKDHYDTAVKLVQSSDEQIFLMQRSSTLLLGPEEGWNEEAHFYNALFSKLKDGVEIRHVVSLDGMIDHLRRPTSKFPGVSDALNALPVEKGIVVLRGPAGSFPVKVVPAKYKDEYTKLDRQARTLISCRTDGTYEAGIVIDLGLTQCHFVMKGVLIQKFWQACRAFYNDCPDLQWEELRKELQPWLSQHKSEKGPNGKGSVL